MSPRLPDFIIGGAPRSGTTWLYHLLDRHPELHLAKPVQPEPKFFLINERYNRGIGHYSDTWFNGLPEAGKVGEKSTNYLESIVAAERIHRHLPHVKMIFMLREPAARALSNWRWSRMNGMETLPFEEALRLESEREATYPPALRFSRPHSYYSRGLYCEMLEPYVELFGLAQILCLHFEDIASDPLSLTRRVHDFLDVEKRTNDADGLGRINPTEPASAEAAAVAALRIRYEEPNRRLGDLLGCRFTPWET
jgi:hypothetical protein